MKTKPAAIVCCLLALGVASCKSREEPAPVSTSASASASASASTSAIAPAPTPDPNAPRLPMGMLSGAESGAAPAATNARRLRSARDVATGEWIELQPAAPGDSPKRTTFEHFRGGSLFLPLDAMTLLHGVFARAQPGFDAFTPQLLDPRALGRLRLELADFQRSWTSVSTVSEAQRQWEPSALVRGLSSDAEWREAQSALALTIGEISRLAEDLEKKGMSAWVLSAH